MTTAVTRVLVGIDFGEPSLEGLRQARELAHGVGGGVAACHVLPATHDLSLLFPERSLGTVADGAHAEETTRKALQDHARTKLGLELTDVFIERGAAYAELVRRAELWGASFIVVGSHGRTGLARAVLGSVAERVARYAHCSVLVARPSPVSGPVLVATDLSDLSLPALAAGAAAAQRNGVPLVVASALEWHEAGFASAGGIIAMLPPIPPVNLRQEMRDTLHSALEGAMAQNQVVGEARVLDGSPAGAIVACAEGLGASLVVVGTHGRTGLGRLALGSVAERVIRGAGCSVLAVRPRFATGSLATYGPVREEHLGALPAGARKTSGPQENSP
jgi:nucleotide-binding universal stress UspA family protein